jgi:hypothetical protein
MTATSPGRTSSHTGITEPSGVSVCKSNLRFSVVKQGERRAIIVRTFHRTNGAQKRRRLSNVPPRLPAALRKYRHSLVTGSETAMPFRKPFRTFHVPQGEPLSPQTVRCTIHIYDRLLAQSNPCDVLGLWMGALDTINNLAYRLNRGLPESINICPGDIAEVDCPAHLERHRL